MYNIITIGDAVVDTHVQIDDASVECALDGSRSKLCLDYAAKVPVVGSFQSLGGNAANVAIGAAKLGLKTAIMASVGKDTNGQFIKNELRNKKINTDFITLDPKTKTRYSIILTYQGERTVLSYHEKRSYKWPKKIPAVGWIYYTSLSAGYEDLQETLFSFLDKHPTVKLALNPGSFQLKDTLSTVQEAVERADLLIVNLEEAERIVGSTLGELKSVQALIHDLLILGPKEVAVTDGARGAWAGNREEIWRLETYPVKVAAKTGAGDAFSSGYLAARIYGHDIPHALEWGTANSCSVITQVGAQNGLLGRKETLKMIERFSTIKPAAVGPFATRV